MFNPGDIVEIVGTIDDDISQRIDGSIAEIVRVEEPLLKVRQTYEVRFIDFKGTAFRNATRHWQPKNLRLVGKIKENNITETDIMSLLESD